MIVALFPNETKTATKETTLGIQKFLADHGIDVVVRDDIAKMMNLTPLSDVSYSDVDFSITIGGDGTILTLVHQYPGLTAPILGINLGSLGFMADIPIDEVYPSLTALIEGNYTIKERIVMEGHSSNNGTCFAVNEMVVHRADNPNIVELAVYVDGSYLNTFAADGLIVATPNGSTAYSLAAGGPILTPELNAIVITPISPHTISNRPIVLCPEHEIVIRLLSKNGTVEVAFDGISRCTLASGESFHITKAKRTFSFVALPTHDYFAALRTKLGWSGKLKK